MSNKPHYYVVPGIDKKVIQYAIIKKITEHVASICNLTIDDIKKHHDTDHKKAMVVDARCLITMLCINQNIKKARIKEYFQLKQQNNINYYQLEAEKKLSIYPDFKQKYALAMAS